MEHQDSLEWRSAVTPDLLSVLWWRPNACRHGLYNYTRHLLETGKTERYEIAIWGSCFARWRHGHGGLALPFGYSPTG